MAARIPAICGPVRREMERVVRYLPKRLGGVSQCGTTTSSSRRCLEFSPLSLHELFG